MHQMSFEWKNYSDGQQQGIIFIMSNHPTVTQLIVV